MNCLFVLNFDNLLCSNARQSFQHAASRWKCDFFELTELNPNVYGHFHKITGIRDYLSDYAQVLYLDADTLIRADAPNPFTVFEGNSVYAVRDAKPDWPPERLKLFKSEVTDPWLIEAQNILGSKLPIENCERWFVNTGMFLLRPKAAKDSIDLFISRMPKKRDPAHERPKWEQGKLEQALWNGVLKLTSPVEHISVDWNYVEPDVSTGRMQHYIYHFTGLNWEWLRQIQPIYDWQSVPA